MSTNDLYHVITAMQTDKTSIITIVVVVILLILIVINIVLGLEKKKRAKNKRPSDTAQDIPEIHGTERVSINYLKLTASPDDITDDMTIDELQAYIEDKMIQGEFRVLEGSIDEDTYSSEYISTDDDEKYTESDTFKFVVSDEIKASEDKAETDIEILRFEVGPTEEGTENISTETSEVETESDLEVLRFEVGNTDDSTENISAETPEDESETDLEVLRFKVEPTEEVANETTYHEVEPEETKRTLELTESTVLLAESTAEAIHTDDVGKTSQVVDNIDISTENTDEKLLIDEVENAPQISEDTEVLGEGINEEVKADETEDVPQLVENIDKPAEPNISPLLNSDVESTENYFTYNTLPEATPINEQNNFDLYTQEYDYTTKSLSELSKIEESAESTVENPNNTSSDKMLTVEELYAARKSEAAYAVPSFSEFISQQKGYGYTDSTEDEFSKYFDGLNDGSANADGIVENTSAWDIKETKSLSSFLQKSAEDGIDLKRMIEEREYGAEEKRKKKRLGLFSRQEQAVEEEEYIDEIDDSILLNDTGFIIKKDKNEVIENLTAEITSQYEQADLWSDPSAAPSAKTEDLASGFIKNEEDDLFFDMPKASFGNDSTFTSVNISDWAESASNQIINNISVSEINIEGAEEQLEQAIVEDDVIDPFLMYKSVFEDTDTLPTADTNSDDELAGVSDMADPFLMYKSAFAQSSEEKVDEPEISETVADENLDTAEATHSTTNVINTNTQPATPYIPQGGGEAVDDIDIGALADSFGIKMDTQTSNFTFMQSTSSTMPNPYTSGQANKAGSTYAQYANRPNPYVPTQGVANPYGQYANRPNPYMPSQGYAANPYAQYAGRPNPYTPTQGVANPYAQYASKSSPYATGQGYVPTPNAQPCTQQNTDGTQQNTENTTQS